MPCAAVIPSVACRPKSTGRISKKKLRGNPKMVPKVYTFQGPFCPQGKMCGVQQNSRTAFKGLRLWFLALEMLPLVLAGLHREYSLIPIKDC